MLDLLPAFVCGLRLMLGKSCGLDPPPFPVNRQHCRQFSSCAPSGGSGNATFPQLVDHSTPQLGTFEQFFYWNTNSWDERNWRQAPIILYLGADHSIQDLDQNINGDDSLVAKLAETVGGAIIYLEHRYWGSSSPFEIGTTSNLQYLTIEQALEDVTHFKENVELPFLTNAQNRLADTPGSNNPPWILIGGGYAGALTVWTAQRTKDHFWAFVASSPVMIAQERFSQFDRAAIEYGPKNCTRDVMRVVEYVDNILEHGTRNEISALKSKFGLESLRDDDFAFVLHIGPLQWTEASISREFSYMEFCDHVEGVYGQMNPHIPIPDEYGVGLERAISGYAMYVESLKRHCEGAGYGAYQGRGNNTRCWDTYEPLNPKFTDITINDGAVRRQWKWLTCNEPYASWPAPPLEGQPSLMSRFVTPGRYARECRLTFPAGEGEGFGLKSGSTFEEFNRKYNGRNISDHDQKLIISHGRMDPYFALSDLSPDGSLDQTTSQTRRFVHPGGSRDDLFLSSGRDHPEMKAVQDAELDQLASWISEYRSDSQRP